MRMRPLQVKLQVNPKSMNFKPLVLLTTLLAACSPAVTAPIELEVEPLTTTDGTNMTSCGNCTAVEVKIIDAFKARGITDKAALAAVLGNIRQESRFTSNVCEGGALVPYSQCRRGGYGLIQWTTVERYEGLGRHARAMGLDPSDIDAQLSYLFTEEEWLKVEPHLQQNGFTIEHYMSHCHNWLGWGVHGARTTYAYNYLLKMP